MKRYQGTQVERGQVSLAKLLNLIPLLILFLILPLQAEEVRLFILHTNDIHGHLEGKKEQDASGGLVRVATVARAIQAAFPGQVVTLDAGDTALGTPLSGLYKGIPTALCMQSLGYDAIALGNHEFDWGQEALHKMMEATGAQVVCANLVNEVDGSHPYSPSTVIERNGLRLGIIGLVAQDTPTRTPKANTIGWTFQDPESAAVQAISELGEVDCVIALTHLGVDADKHLARSVSGLNLIVGGHSHTPLYEPLIENGVPIVQAGCYSHFLGVLEVLIDSEKKSLKLVSYHLVPIDDSFAPDPRVSSIVAKYAQKLSDELDRKAGQADHAILNLPEPNSVDTPLGDIIADILAEETRADIGLFNRGGIRGSLAAGPISLHKIHEMLPFDNRVVVVEASAQELKAIIAQSLTARAQLSPSKSLEVKILKDNSTELSFRGKPLEAGKTYTLAVPDFIATGGDNMSSFQKLKVIKIFGYTRELIIDGLKKISSLTAPSQRRVVRLQPNS